MELIKVTDKKTRKEFIKVAKIIYKNDDIWVCPLDNEIDAIFDTGKNVYYNHGEAERWIIKDNNNKFTGRMAAFIDHNTAHSQDQPTGGMGFFECINDKKTAYLLFDTAKKWLKEKGMEAMDGPINFGETDKYWGLLVDGFTHPSYEIAYNHRYYQDLFESYGFKTYYKQEGFHVDLTKEFPEKFIKIAEWVTKKPGYKFKHFRWKEKEKFTEDFAEAFNLAWAPYKENFEPLKPEYIRKTLTKAKAIIDEEFVWLAYHNGQPNAISLMYPDVNMILKHMNGKLSLWNKLKFVYLKQKKTITRIRGVLLGVIPKFQGLGVEAAVIWNIAQSVKNKPQYKEVELSWVADFNPKMRKIFVMVGGVSAKHYITYRYLFDRNATFKRYPMPEEIIEKRKD